jgi:hypothetical protein
VAARLGKSRVVEYKDAHWIGERPGQHRSAALSYRLIIPGAFADELLQALVGVLRAL